MRTVSLFAGCGGADLGIIGDFNFSNTHYGKMPFEIIYANDIDPKALNTHKRNFRCINTECKDISEVKIEDIPEHELLVGGFPCQSFSTVNPTKDPYDERANLYKQMVRVLKGKTPKYFIAENVKGFMTLYRGSIFKKACNDFQSCGYELSFALLNCADFGVPQKRERVFIVGVRKDLNVRFVFPEKTHSEFQEDGKKQWVPLGAVIDKLQIDDPKYYFSQRAVAGMKNAKNNMKRGLYQDLSKPCLTVTSHLAKVSLNSRDPVLLVDAEKEIYRRFTPREVARIQSFPDDFEFEGSEADSYRQIGNAIPPVMMWTIVNSLAQQFKNF